MRRVLDWVFRSRETGRIVVAQRPNLLLGLFLAAWLAMWLVPAGGRFAEPLRVLAQVLLGLWAADELFRGVNPWRQFLGFSVLAYLAITALR